MGTDVVTSLAVAEEVRSCGSCIDIHPSRMQASLLQLWACQGNDAIERKSQLKLGTVFLISPLSFHFCLLCRLQAGRPLKADARVLDFAADEASANRGGRKKGY